MIRISGSCSISEGGTNGWAPSSAMLFHDDKVHTSVRFNGLEPARRRDSTWRIRIRVYGADPLEPVWEQETEPFDCHEQFELTSDEVARDLGVDRLEHYAEFYPYSTDLAPHNDQIVAPVFQNFRSRDGSFEAHLPSSYIYGSRRAYKMRSELRYQQFPGVDVGGDLDLIVCLVNANVRKGRFWVSMVPADGGPAMESGPHIIRPKSVVRWRSEETAAMDSQLVGVIIKSSVLAPAFVGNFNRATGLMAGLDHTHPFFPA